MSNPSSDRCDAKANELAFYRTMEATRGSALGFRVPPAIMASNVAARRPRPGRRPGEKPSAARWFPDSSMPRGVDDPRVLAAMRGGPPAPLRPRAPARPGLRRPLAADRVRPDDLPALRRGRHDPAPGRLAASTRSWRSDRAPGTRRPCSRGSPGASIRWSASTSSPGAPRRCWPRSAFHNVSIKAFDGTYGYPAAAPYDRILVTAGTETVPEPLLAQLAVGGRLVVPIGAARQAAAPRHPPAQDRLRAGGGRGRHVRAAARPLRGKPGVNAAPARRSSSGRVQGVGFRFFAERAARELGVTRLGAQPPRRLRRDGRRGRRGRRSRGISARLKQGPRPSRVDAVAVGRAARRREFAAFEITG